MARAEAPPAPRRDRARHGRADDHRARHRRPEAEAPREDPLDRGDLVPGLLRARRGLRPLRRAHDRAARARGRPLRRRRPEGLVVVRAHRRLVHPRHPQRPRQRAPRGPRPTCSSTCTRRASRCARCARSPARPSSTRSSSPTSRCRSRTSSATIGGGWQVAMTTLLHERGTLGFALTAGLESQIRKLIALAKEKGATRGAARRDRARVDRPAGGALHELPLADDADEDRASPGPRAPARSSGGRRRTSA